jgi:urease accessory protein
MKTEIQKSSSNLKAVSLLALFALAPLMAQAHPGHGPANSFASGLNHPLSGWDHILAMVAVGLWAAQMGGRSLWAVPAAFVSLMTVGGALGMLGVPLPMVETGILVSVLALGMLIVAAARLPLAVSMGIVGVFALFHGHAHGTEIPAAASGLNYALGFVLGTALLHACGIGVGLLAQKRFIGPSALRLAGAAIVLGGLCLWLG